MATGGRDDYTSDTGLDLREVESELQALDELELDTTDESLFWEEHKAQTEYEKLEAETSGELEFSWFHLRKIYFNHTVNRSNSSVVVVQVVPEHHLIFQRVQKGTNQS